MCLWRVQLENLMNSKSDVAEPVESLRETERQVLVLAEKAEFVAKS